MRREQRPHPSRQGELLYRRRRPADAGQEEPSAARSQMVPPAQGLTAACEILTMTLTPEPRHLERRTGVSLLRGAIGAMTLAAALALGAARAQTPVPSKHPDWSGQWRVQGGNRWDPTKGPGRDQEAPLTPEYVAIFEASLADQAVGGPGNDPR